MRIIANKDQSKCLACGHEAIALPVMGGFVMCSNCESPNIIDKQTQTVFQPIYEEVETFRASIYTPPIPNRRKRSVPWPKIKERRRYGSL